MFLPLAITRRNDNKDSQRTALDDLIAVFEDTSVDPRVFVKNLNDITRWPRRRRWWWRNQGLFVRVLAPSTGCFLPLAMAAKELSMALIAL